MQFVSIQFFFYFVLLIAALKISKQENTRHWVLLFASYIFYAYWDYRFLALLLIQTCVAYFTGLFLAQNSNSKGALVGGITATLIVLGFFKYFNFFIETFCRVFSIANTFSLSIILPTGISFYTFQAISYMVDIYRGIIPAECSFKRIAVYIGFFPQIMSGPIVKAHDFLPQLQHEHRVQKENLIQGGQIFLFGVVKKFVIADRLGVCVDAIYNAPAAYSWTAILIAVFTYSFQIYCDFSGYSDMAIGIGKALGYDLGRNFNCPYIVSSPSDFWRRWHISLSSWFKEYVYFPLGGNRKGLSRTLLNLMIVMLLSGLWHGASWTFVFWGALHGIASVMQKLFNECYKKSGQQHTNSRTKYILCVLANFVFVSFCWIPFRASSFENMFAVIKGLATLQAGIRYVYAYAVVYVGICVLSTVYVAVRRNGNAEYPQLNFTKFSSWVLLWLVLLVVVVFSYEGNIAFIYSQF